MRSVSAGLGAHFDEEVTTVATRWKVTRRDGVIVGFTSHVEDVEIGGVTYHAATGSTPSSTSSSADLSVDNLEVLALLDENEVTEADLLAGLYDYATVEIAEFNYTDLSQGEMIIRTGTLGEHTVGRNQVRVELRGVMQVLQQVIGRLHLKRCDADLYDSRCKVERVYFSQVGTVVTAASRLSFTVSGLVGAAGWFDGGVVTWGTGLNAGLSMEIKRWTNSPDTIDLHFAMPFAIQAGDTFETAPGCDLTLETCRDKFDNVVNFRGFPHIPTRDKVLAYPDAPT